MSELKTQESEFGNKVYRELLDKSNMKQRIIIGHHNLNEVPHKDLFGEPGQRKYDGVHMFGKSGRYCYTTYLKSSRRLEYCLTTNPKMMEEKICKPTTENRTIMENSTRRKEIVCSLISTIARRELMSEKDLNTRKRRAGNIGATNRTL